MLIRYLLACVFHILSEVTELCLSCHLSLCMGDQIQFSSGTNKVILSNLF